MISVEHLSKRYGSIHAVRDLSFEARAGEILGFLGPNGAGKSTTMRILTGYLCPSEGGASVAGFDVVERPLDVRRRVGYLPEHTPVYADMTVLEYLRFVAEVRGVPRAERRAAIARVLADCGLEGVRRRLIGHLSKGFRQRTCLAQALVHHPPVLILDEPTSGLDPNQIVEIRSLIRQLGLERTVVWSTHILSEVEALCSRVLIVNEGRVVALGTPQELRGMVPESRPLRVTLRCAQSEDAVRERLLAIPGVAAVGVHPSPDGEHELELRSDDGEDPRAEVSALAAAQRWTLVTLAREEPTLEDVFRYLTRQEEA